MVVTNSPEHIKTYIEGTIERLGFTPDLYYLHRIDPSKPPFGSKEFPNKYADRAWTHRHPSRVLNPRPGLHP
jgi:aryl-alcohol dehydrogenase-like predicted oxidoreductase